MTCEDKSEKFKTVMESVISDFRNGLDATARSVEDKASKIADKTAQDNDLAQGIGATAGSAIGGLIGGAPGASVGATIGKAIGSMFVVEVTEVTHSASMDVPEINIVDQELIFDIPELEMRDTDIVFTIPTLVMKTVPGPQQPVPVCTTERRCVGYRIPNPFGSDWVDEKCFDVPVCKVEMRPTTLDVPTWENREQRIVIGMPAISLRSTRMVVGIPNISMVRKDFSFNIPSITVRFVKDVGASTAAAIQAIQSDAQSELAQKKVIFRERMRIETVPYAVEMFDCYKAQIRDSISNVTTMFDPQISQISESLKSLIGKGVPEDDDDYVDLKTKIDTLIFERASAIRGLQETLAQLEATSAEAIQRLVNEDFE
jgi:ElaB/YqjD/DUF883 family membrane-anchored ribosome-binding protein